MQISFGKKIPISTCKIYNKEAKKFERATLYEVDCREESDIDYLSSPDGMWEFKNSIAYDARSKYYESLLCLNQDSQDKFYSLEAKDGTIACLCETQPFFKDTNIRYIESNPDKFYKYAGQIMLANIAKLLLKTSQSMQIQVPSFDARDFYSKVCEFKEDMTGFGYELAQKDMKNFIQRAEKRTNGKIINFKG